METSTTLATTVVNLLSNYFNNDTSSYANQPASGMGERIFGWVRQKLSGTQGEQALRDLEAEPRSQTRQMNLFEYVKRYFDTHPEGTNEISGMISQVGIVRSTSSFFDSGTTHIETATESSTTLATCAVNLLSHYLTNDQTALATGRPTTVGERLLSWMRQKLTGQGCQKALRELEENPNNSMHQAALIDHLKGYLDAHPESKDDLKRLFSDTDFSKVSGMNAQYAEMGRKPGYFQKAVTSGTIATMAVTLLTSLLRNDKRSTVSGEPYALSEKILGWLRDHLSGDDDRRALEAVEDRPESVDAQSTLVSRLKNYLDMRPEALTKMKNLFSEEGFSQLAANFVDTGNVQELHFTGAAPTPTNLATTAVNLISDYWQKGKTASMGGPTGAIGEKILSWLQPKLPGEDGLTAFRDLQADPDDSGHQWTLVQNVRDYLEHHPEAQAELKTLLTQNGITKLEDDLDDASIITKLREILDSFKL